MTMRDMGKGFLPAKGFGSVVLPGDPPRLKGSWYYNTPSNDSKQTSIDFGPI